MNVAAARAIFDLDKLREMSLAVPALAGKVVRSVEHVSMWAKPGRYFNVHYRAVCADSTNVALSAFVVSEKRARHEADRYRGDAYLASPVILILPFPLDYRLATLPESLRCETVTQHAGCFLEPSQAQVVGYRPGKRCQIRYRDRAGRTVFGKVSYETTPGQFFEQLRKARRAVVRAERRLRLPRAIAHIEELSLTLVEGLGGTSLYDAARSGKEVASDVIEEVAKALAELHQADRSELERHFQALEELELVRGWTQLTGRLFPELASSLGAAIDLLERDLPEPDRPPRAVIHRDFYDRQVLLSTGPPGMIDVDTLCLGDPELDMGNFLAHTKLRTIQNHGDSRFARTGETFLRSYPLDFDRVLLSWYQRSALLRLSCVYAVRPVWHKITGSLLNCEREARRKP